MNHIAILNALRAHLSQSVNFTLRSDKRKYPLMWVVYVVSFMWIWNRKFMDDFITTIPVVDRVYFPAGMLETAPGDVWPVLAHEGRHLVDEKANRAWYIASYLFPQGLALLALLAIPFSLWWLLALVALAPWPAPGRARIERRAYQVSIVMDSLRGWDITADWYAPQRADEYGWSYYRMVWRRSVAERWVAEDIAHAHALLVGAAHDDYITPLIALVKGAA